MATFRTGNSRGQPDAAGLYNTYADHLIGAVAGSGTLTEGECRELIADFETIPPLHTVREGLMDAGTMDDFS